VAETSEHRFFLKIEAEAEAEAEAENIPHKTHKKDILKPEI